MFCCYRLCGAFQQIGSAHSVLEDPARQRLRWPCGGTASGQLRKVSPVRLGYSGCVLAATLVKHISLTVSPELHARITSSHEREHGSTQVGWVLRVRAPVGFLHQRSRITQCITTSCMSRRSDCVQGATPIVPMRCATLLPSGYGIVSQRRPLPQSWRQARSQDSTGSAMCRVLLANHVLRERTLSIDDPLSPPYMDELHVANAHRKHASSDSKQWARRLLHLE